MPSSSTTSSASLKSKVLEEVFPRLDIETSRWGNHSLETIHSMNDTYHRVDVRLIAPGTSTGNGELIVVLHASFWKKKKQYKYYEIDRSERTAVRVLANTIAAASDTAIAWWESKEGLNLDEYDYQTTSFEK